MWPRAGRIPGTVTSGAGKGESDVGEEQEDPESQKSWGPGCQCPRSWQEEGVALGGPSCDVNDLSWAVMANL